MDLADNLGIAVRSIHFLVKLYQAPLHFAIDHCNN